MPFPLLIHLLVSLSLLVEVDIHSALILFSRPTNPSAEPYPGTESVRSMSLLELPRGSMDEDGCNAVTKTEARPLSSQICFQQER